MTRRVLAAVIVVLAFAAAAPGQINRGPGWGMPPVVDFEVSARTLRSGLDWRKREEAAERLGGSGDLRWVAILAAAAASDPSLRVRDAAQAAIASIREANGRRDPVMPPPPNPWDPSPNPVDHYAEMIDSWFQQYLRRPVDQGGLSSRLGLLRRGTDPEQIEADILGSGEYWDNHGGNLLGFLRALYNDILQREPTRQDLRFWADRYDQNSGNRSAVAREFLQAVAAGR
jgi:hypothetical protein